MGQRFKSCCWCGLGVRGEAAKPIRHYVDTLKLFKQLELDAPMTTEEVPALLEKLEGMLEDYEAGEQKAMDWEKMSRDSCCDSQVKVKEWEGTREQQKRRILEGGSNVYIYIYIQIDIHVIKWCHFT